MESKKKRIYKKYLFLLLLVVLSACIREDSGVLQVKSSIDKVPSPFTTANHQEIYRFIQEYNRSNAANTNEIKRFALKYIPIKGDKARAGVMKI